MKANYHTHSRWCRHAVGEIEDYIEEAIRCGFDEIAMTEHVPHNHTEDSWIPWEQFPAYDRALNRAVQEYKGRIHVIKGFECEYYPDEMDDYRRFQEVYGYELLILGQHRCGKNKEVDIFAPKGAYKMHVYADDVCRGLETGLFRFLAHPDCVLEGYPNLWDKECESVMRQIFQACEELHIPVEINGNGMRYNRRYPSEPAFLLSKEYQLQYMINSDAHAPEKLYDEGVRKAEEFADKLGLKIMQSMRES